MPPHGAESGPPTTAPAEPKTKEGTGCGGAGTGAGAGGEAVLRRPKENCAKGLTKFLLQWMGEVP